MSIKRKGCNLYQDGNCKITGKLCNYIPKRCTKLNNKVIEVDMDKDKLARALTLAHEISNKRKIQAENDMRAVTAMRLTRIGKRMGKVV